MTDDFESLPRAVDMALGLADSLSKARGVLLAALRLGHDMPRDGLIEEALLELGDARDLLTQQLEALRPPRTAAADGEVAA